MGIISLEGFSDRTRLSLRMLFMLALAAFWQCPAFASASCQSCPGLRQRCRCAVDVGGTRGTSDGQPHCAPSSGRIDTHCSEHATDGIAFGVACRTE